MSYASKAQLQTVAEAVNAKFAKKGGDYSADGLVASEAKRANNLVFSGTYPVQVTLAGGSVRTAGGSGDVSSSAELLTVYGNTEGGNSVGNFSIVTYGSNLLNSDHIARVCAAEGDNNTWGTANANNGFQIKGTATGVYFGTTAQQAQAKTTQLTIETKDLNGTPVRRVMPTQSGYLFVDGADATTAVTVIWSGSLVNETPDQYVTNTKAIPVSTYFPNGMRSLGDRRDYMTPSAATQAICYVNLGSLTYTLDRTVTVDDESVYVFRTAVMGTSLEGASDTNTATMRISGSTLSAASVDAVIAGANDSIAISGSTGDILVTSNTATTPEQIKTQLNDVYLEAFYRANVVTTITPSLDWSLVENDFGLEEITTSTTIAPVVLSILYGISASDEIKNLPSHYVGTDSFKNYSDEFENKLGIKTTATYNAASSNWSYNIDPTAFIGVLRGLIQDDYGKDPLQYSVSTMSAITNAGMARMFYSIGDTRKISRGGSDVDYQIIGFDAENVVETGVKHTITWQQKYAPGFRWDEPEMLFYVDPEDYPDGLPAGTYNITSYKGAYGSGTAEDGTFQFTTTQAIPAGGGFRHTSMGAYRSSYDKSNILGAKITTYGAPGETYGERSTIETGLVVSEGTGGTSLGRFTFSDYTYHNNNHPNTNNFTGHNAYGDSNYCDYPTGGPRSDIDEYINSQAGAGEWWHKKTNWSLRHISYASKGYLNGIDQEIYSAMVTCKKAVGVPTKNTSTMMQMERKVFLLSNGEVGFSTYSSEGKLYEFYANAIKAVKGNTSPTNDAIAGRCKLSAEGGSGVYWWLRSPYRSYSANAIIVTPSGAYFGTTVNNANGCAPAFATR